MIVENVSFEVDENVGYLTFEGDFVEIFEKYIADDFESQIKFSLSRNMAEKLVEDIVEYLNM